MSAPEYVTEPVSLRAQRLLGGLVMQIGGLVTGLGVAFFIMIVGTWQQRNGTPSLPAFLVTLALLLAGLLVVRRRRSPKGFAFAAALYDTARVTLAWAIGILVVATFLRDLNMSMDKAYRAAMKSDLRNLHEAQADIHGDSGRYVVRIDSLPASTGVSKPEIRLTADGWYAFVTHAAIGHRCGIYVGTRPAEGPMTFEGEAACDIIGGVPFRWGKARSALRIILLGLIVGITGAYVVRRAASSAPAETHPQL